MVTDQDKKVMHQITDWKTEIGVIAGPFLPTDTKESWLSRAHENVRRINKKITFRTIERMFYGYVTDPKHSVAASVLSAADQARLERGKRDAAKAVEIYRVAMQRMENVDPDFYRSEIDVLERAIGAAGLLDRSGA